MGLDVANETSLGPAKSPTCGAYVRRWDDGSSWLHSGLACCASVLCCHDASGLSCKGSWVRVPRQMIKLQDLTNRLTDSSNTRSEDQDSHRNIGQAGQNTG